MKSEDILTALNHLPDEMIESSAKGRQKSGEAKVSAAARILKPALAAASVALILGGSLFTLSRFGISTADEATHDNCLSDTANETTPVKEDFNLQYSDNAHHAENYYSADADMTVTETEESDIAIKNSSPTTNESISVNISFTDGGIALKSGSGVILSHIDLHEYADSSQISVGSITLNHSEKNIERIHSLLSLMEKSPVISPDSLTESEDDCMAALHFDVSDGWMLTADSVHEPIRTTLELLSQGFVRISVDGFSPIYISVGEEALTEFTNGLEYILVND